MAQEIVISSLAGRVHQNAQANRSKTISSHVPCEGSQTGGPRPSSILAHVSLRARPSEHDDGTRFWLAAQSSAVPRNCYVKPELHDQRLHTLCNRGKSFSEDTVSSRVRRVALREAAASGQSDAAQRFVHRN